MDYGPICGLALRRSAETTTTASVLEILLRIIECKLRLCQLWQFDIDDILRVAEQRSVEEFKNSATDQLLSQFKVTIFVTCTPAMLLQAGIVFGDVCLAVRLSTQNLKLLVGNWSNRYEYVLWWMLEVVGIGSWLHLTLSAIF